MQEIIGNKLKELYSDITDNLIQVQKTRPEFEGDVTLVVFPLLRITKKNPEESAKFIGEFLKKEIDVVNNFNVVKGFLNLEIETSYWLNKFNAVLESKDFGKGKDSGKTYIIEYSSPNTNKPLHLGHLRNNFLGYSVAEILKANGHEVVKTQIINDRGIHICKSMLAWEKFGNNETPESSGLKGDKLVGKYYVVFDKEYKKQLIEIKTLANVTFAKTIKKFEERGEWIPSGTDYINAINKAFLNYLEKMGIDVLKATNGHLSKFDNDNFKFHSKFIISENNDEGKRLSELQEYFFISTSNYDFVNEKSDSIIDKGVKEIIQFCEKELEQVVPIFKEAQEMLMKWEKSDPKTIELWKKMNQWVYDGFAITYNAMGVDFDKLYYESETYILGKDILEEGLSKKTLYKKEDGSVWCDLSAEKMDDKLLLRGDGTSVYMTQDVGTAVERFKDYPNTTGMIYTVGNEQDYHFKVLFIILKKLGYSFADECSHLSYGMVNLPTGRMKSREGTVVDADDLMQDVVDDARAISEERGHIEGMSEEEKTTLFQTIGMGGLKYYLLKVDPKKSMMFNPEESIDLNGNTGPFIQYTYARTQSILRKQKGEGVIDADTKVVKSEVDIIKHLLDLPEMIKEAGKNQSPALVSNYTYELVKLYNSFYQSVSIFKEEDSKKQNLRLKITQQVAETVEFTMSLLGINVPEKM